MTVLTAARDAERWIGEALGSVAAQRLDDLEAIVVDDGSTDGTAERVRQAARRDPRIRLLRLGSSRGQAGALNEGLAEARGRYLALLDADDVALPDRLGRQVAFLQEEPGCVLVGGAAETFCDRRGLDGAAWRYPASDDDLRALTLFQSGFLQSSMTLDRERAGAGALRFDASLRVGADWALSNAAMRLGRVANLEEVVLRYRVRAGQLSGNLMDDLASDSTRIRREALAWAGVTPTDDELRVHLAVSPCQYWPVGAHRFFPALRATLRQDARRWLERLWDAAAARGVVPAAALRARIESILALVEERLEGSLPGVPCPAAAPGACLGDGPCR